MADFKMTFTDEDFGDVPKPKIDAQTEKLTKLANKQLEKDLPKIVDVHNIGKAKDFSAKQANLAKYATYGSETYGKLGFDPFKSGGIPGKKSGMDVLYDDNTNWTADIGRAWDGMWKLAGIGFQDTIGLGAFADSGNYLDFEETMNKYSSSRGGNAGFWSNTMLSSGYTVGIIGGIAAEELALAGLTAATGGAASPLTAAAGGTLLVRGIERIKQAGNMLKFVNKLQDVKTASSWLGSSVKGFGKALNPLENTMDFFMTADKLKDLNGLKQTALGVGSVVRDARKITMSHGESKLEAELAKKEFKEKMFDEWYIKPERAGKPIPDSYVNTVEKQAQSLYNDVYKANFGLIYVTNAITFDNMLKTMKGTNKFFSNATDLFKVVKKEGGKVAVEAMKKNVWNYGRKKLGELSWRGSLKSVLSSSMEGVQELGQDIISESNKSYYARNVKGTQLRGGFMTYLEKDLKEASMKPFVNLNPDGSIKRNEDGDIMWSGQGLSTFLSGALMGVFASPVGVATQATQGYLFDGGVNKTYQYFADREQFRKEKIDAVERRKEKAKILTQFFNDNKNFTEAWSKPVYSQSELQEEILEAGERGDQKTMKNKQHESLVTGVRTLLQNGMEEEFAKHLDALGTDLNAQQLNEIFSRTDITEENKGEWQKKLKDQASTVRNLRGVYDEINNTINNPINIKSLDRNDPEFMDKLFKYQAIENLKQELLFSHAKIADRANRQDALRKEINKENPLTTLEINALLDDNALEQQIQLLKTEVETNTKLTTSGDAAVENQAQARKKLKAYQNYQQKLKEYKAEQRKEDGAISESDTFDDLFDAYNEILEVSGKNKLISPQAQRAYNRQQFDKVFDYLSLGEENEFYQQFVDTVLNPEGSSAYIEGQEAMLKRLEENKEDHILTALYEYDKKAVSDDMLNALYDNDLFFDLQELDELLNQGIMPRQIFDVTNNKEATPEQYEQAQQIIGSYIKKLTGKTITNDKTKLNKQGRKLKSDKRTVATLLNKYKVKLNNPIKLSSKEGQRLLDKLMDPQNKFMTSMDKEILAKLGQQDVTIKFVSDNTLPVQLTEDGVIELDIRFAGKDYKNSVMSFENLIVTGLTQHAITEKLKTNDDMYMAARSAMEQAKKEFQRKYPSTNVEEIPAFNDVNVFMTEAMNDLQFQKFLATVEDNVQPASQSLWKTLSDGIGELVEEDFDKKLANRVINIAAKALDDTIVDNIAETAQESKEVKQEREAAQKEKAEELTKLAKELGERWNVNVQVINTQDEARDILNKLDNPFEQRFSQILNDLMYPPVEGFDLRKVVNPEIVNLKDLLRAVMEKSGSLTELIANIKELSIYQTNSKVFDMVNFLSENADNIGDAVETVKNIFFQTDKDVTAGFYDEKTNTAYIVADAVKENTLYHEIFLHPFLINLEKSNPEFYKQLVAEAKANQDIIDYVEKNYGTEEQIGSRQFEHELVGRAYDLSVDNKISERTEPGLFKKIGQFIKRMASKVGEFLNLTKNDISKFDPKKTTIADLANYSVNTTDKINLGKVIEADRVAQSTEETVKPRTKKTKVQTVRTVVEEQTVNKGGDLVVLDDAFERPDLFGDFLHPEIISNDNLLIAEWTQKIVDLGQELDDARITKWVYGNVRAQVGGRLIIDVTAEIPVFVKKALKNKKANPRVAELQSQIEELDARIKELSDKKATVVAPGSPVTSKRLQEELDAIEESDGQFYITSLPTTWRHDTREEAEAAVRDYFQLVNEKQGENLSGKRDEARLFNKKDLEFSIINDAEFELLKQTEINILERIVSNLKSPAERQKALDFEKENYIEEEKKFLEFAIKSTQDDIDKFNALPFYKRVLSDNSFDKKHLKNRQKDLNDLLFDPALYIENQIKSRQESLKTADGYFYDKYSKEVEKLEYLKKIFNNELTETKGTSERIKGIEEEINKLKSDPLSYFIDNSGTYFEDTTAIVGKALSIKVKSDLVTSENQSQFDTLNVQESLENDTIDREIEAALKKRNALQDQLNLEDAEEIEEGEELVQQGTKKVKFLMYKSTGTGSTAESIGEWVPLIAIGRHPNGDEWFVKSYYQGNDPKFDKYGSSVFADIDRDLKTQEATLFTEPENWVTETTTREVVEETEVEEEIPVDEQDEVQVEEDQDAYRPRTEILNDLSSIQAEIKKLEAEYDKLKFDIDSNKLSLVQKRKAKRKLDLLAIDINDLYSQLNDMQPELDVADNAINLAMQDLDYVPAFDYNGNEIITHLTPWMDIPQSLRNEISELYGKPLNKLSEEDVVKIKEQLKSNPEYIAVVNAFTQERLRSQDEKLGAQEAEKNRQRIAEEKLKRQQQQKDFRAQAKATKKQKRLAKTKVSDEDILKSVLKDFDYSILSAKEIKQLVAKLKDKTLPIRFTAEDIVAYISNKKAKEAQKEQAKKDIEEQKERAKINAQIKSNMELLQDPVIPFTTSYRKKVNLRIPNNGMRKFIMTYYPEIFALSKQEFLDEVNNILLSRNAFSKQFTVDPKLFVKGDKKIYLKIYNLVKKLEKQKQLYPDVVKKINLALYDADTNWRVRMTGKNGSISSMYQIKKVTSTKKITPPGVYGSAKKLIFEYDINEGNPSQLDYHVALIQKFIGVSGTKIQMNAVEDVFGAGSSESKAWKSITSEDAPLKYKSFDGASLALLEGTFEDSYQTAEALEDFLMSYSSLNDAIKKVAEKIKSNIEQEEGPKYDENLEPFLRQGMTLEEAADALLTIEFLNTPEGQQILDAEAAELDRIAQSMENQLLNGEFEGNEDNLSDPELELLNIGESEEDVADEVQDVESMPEENVPAKELSQIDKYLQEIEDIAALPFEYQLSNTLGRVWEQMRNADEKQGNLEFAIAAFKFVTAGRFNFSEAQVNQTLDFIKREISKGSFRDNVVLINQKPYRVTVTVKGKVVLQDLQNLKEYPEFEITDFLQSVERVFKPGETITNINVDTVVKVEEFDYIKGAYNDILNNFTSYMGEANSLTEEELLSNLKKETTKCK
jgi:hypothetical protein